MAATLSPLTIVDNSTLIEEYFVLAMQFNHIEPIKETDQFLIILTYLQSNEIMVYRVTHLVRKTASK